MNTEVTIPWDAVINHCPPSRARRLPLVIANRAAHSDPTTLAHLLAAPLAERVQNPRAQKKPMAMINRTPTSTLLELPHQTSIIILTSDNKTSIRLQANWNPMSTWLTDPACYRDAYARTYIVRYARLDPDARAFVPADSIEEDQPNTNPHFEFLNPQSWGFTATPTSMHWTANNLFASPLPTKTPPKHSPTRKRFKDPFEEPTPDRGDPFRCIPQLRQLRSLCDQAPAQIRSYGLALCLGRCRLFGVKLTEADDFTLSATAFEQCSTFLIDRLKDLYCRAKALQAKNDGYLHRNLALELLETRMDAHAAYQALDEAYAAARYESAAEADMMGRRLNQVRRIIHLFDNNLKKQLPLLRLAASTFLLENWRRLLAPSHRASPPWWLGGCLE